MLANGLKWVFERERNTMSSYLMLFLLLLDIYSRCVIAYLSSPHVGQEPAYTAQQSPVMSSPLALTASSAAPAVTDSYLSRCPSGGLCSRLPADCIICAFHHNCIYGRPASFTCRAKAGVHCVSDQSQPQQNFSLTLDCRFCWQLDPSQYRCSNSTSCMTVSCPRRLYNATCEALEHVHCLGTHTHTHTHTHRYTHTNRYTHTHTHTHTDTHTHTHTHRHTHTHTHRYTHTHTHTDTHTHTHTHTEIHTHTHTHTHTNRYTHTLSLTHSYTQKQIHTLFLIHTHTCTHTQTDTHTHTHTLSLSLTHTHTHTQTNRYTLSLSLSLSLSHTHTKCTLL
uniref:Uncharacterized protein n=1 Tax=Cyprinus carpio carpio TaxID=630221 RepID=A0A9J7ZYD4_CYPCA